MLRQNWIYRFFSRVDILRLESVARAWVGWRIETSISPAFHYKGYDIIEYLDSRFTNDDPKECEVGNTNGGFTLRMEDERDAWRKGIFACPAIL